MQFSPGTIEFLGILAAAVLVVGNILLAWAAATRLSGLDNTVLDKTMPARTGGNSTVIFDFWLATLSLATGMCIRVLRPEWAETFRMRHRSPASWKLSTSG